MDRDTRITVCGLVNAIINSGAPPEDWEKLAAQAYTTVDKTLLKIEKVRKMQKEGGTNEGK